MGAARGAAGGCTVSRLKAQTNMVVVAGWCMWFVHMLLQQHAYDVHKQLVPQWEVWGSMGGFWRAIQKTDPRH
jgi:hypothetical protein